MTTSPPEPQDVSPSKNLSLRMSEEDWKPLQKGCDAAGIAASVLIRECLVRYGQQTLVEIARDREFEAKTVYKISGKRRYPRRSSRSDTIRLDEIVCFKFQIDLELAERWIRLGRILVGGEPVTDPSELIERDAIESVTKA